MKRIIFHILTLAVMAFSSNSAIAQESTYVRQPGYWTFGINGGLAYQSSDVPIDWKGWGAGLTLAKNFYYKPGAPLSFDLRGRFLYDKSYGLDYMPAYGLENNEALNGQRGNGMDYTLEGGGPGYVYQNHETTKGELALEGVIHLNKLREKTNFDVSIFGGLGLDWYKANIDQRNFDGLYTQQYTDLDPRSSVSFKKDMLRNNILDGDFETNAQGFSNSGKLGIMPDLGIEVGYQLTPRFSMGVGHKLTFARTDILDGEKWNDSNFSTGNNDLHHYTNLHARWIIDPGQRQKLLPPVIQLTRPTVNPFTSRDPNGYVGARIKHINSAMDISCTVNGHYSDFNFRGDVFSLNLPLEPGRNEVVIKATNAAGSDQKIVVLNFRDGVITPPPPPTTTSRPRVRITNPNDRNHTTREEYFDLVADIDNVRDKRDISFTINDRAFYQFDFNPSNGRLRAPLQLQRGRNYIVIKAQNRSGSDQDETMIEFQDRNTHSGRKPVVRITKPYADPYRTEREKVSIEAEIENVRDQRDVRVRMNGRDLRDFAYDGRVMCVDVYLKPGENELEVIGENTRGRDRDSRILILDEPYRPPLRQPAVDFIRPAQNNTTSRTQRYDVEARIKNVSQRSNIRFYHNGDQIRNFDYQNGTLRYEINLDRGSNNVSIEASNEVGSDEETVFIRYNPIVVNTVKRPEVEITKPVSSTSSRSNITVKAVVKYVSRKQDINVSLNGNQVSNFSFNSGTGKVSSNLSLKAGRNTIIVKAENRDGSDQDSKVITYNAPDNPPQVTITQPTASSTTNANITLKARVLKVNNRDDITLQLNGRSISNFSFSREILSANLTLKAGRNTIIVKAENRDGSDQDSKVITYNAPNNPPQVTITQPTASSTSNANITLKARVLKVNERDDITLQLNGRSISNFSFSKEMLSANLTLKAGRNTIIVKAENRDGSDQDSKVITYKASIAGPKVTITSPKNGARLNKNSVIVKASITGVSNRSNVRYFVNNKVVNNFNFSGKGFNAITKLVNGKNTLKISASNQAGSDEASIVVYYNPVILVDFPKPVVRFINPEKPGQNIDKRKLVVKVRVKNIESKGDIDFKVNGKLYNNFSFNPANNLMTAAITTGSGTTKLEVKASNKAGSTIKKSSVIYKAVIGGTTERPEVSIISVSEPNNDPLDPDRDKSTVVASTKNISSRNQVSVKVNGKNADFSFNTRTKVIAATFTLDRGNNEIVIVVTNEAGSDTERRTIKY